MLNRQGWPRLRRWTIRVLCLLLALPLVTAAILALKWPFSRSAVVHHVSTDINVSVEMASFQTTYFPPGYRASGIRLLDRRNGNATLLTLEDVTVRASYFDLLRLVPRLTSIEASGFHFFALPRAKPHQGRLSGPPDIGHIHVNRAIFTFPAASNGRAFSLPIDDLALDDMHRGRSFPFRGTLHTGLVPGKLTAEGRFGPWNWNAPAISPLSGSYRYTDGKLGALKGVSGSLESRGTFQGKLGSVLLDGEAEVPNFRVTTSGHPVHVKSVFQSNLNLTNGDAQIIAARSSFSKTEVLAKGMVLGQPGENAKTITLDLKVANGRVDDLLFLFTRRDKPMMRGAIHIEAHAELPSTPARFLERLKLIGDFGISQGYFTGEELQGEINSLADSASNGERKQPEDSGRAVSSELRGHVAARNGIAHLTGFTLTFPGSRATVQGNFGLSDRSIAMKGTLTTKGKLSDTTSSLTAVALKVYSVFLKKRRGATVIPFHINGTAGEPKFRLSLR